MKLNYRIGPPRAGDVVAVYSDTRKTASVLGWQPRFGIDAMMASAWKWQQELLRQS
jgi:UDP-glucose 4-epimerase